MHGSHIKYLKEMLTPYRSAVFLDRKVKSALNA